MLAALPVFAGLPRAGLERLATALTEERAAPGTTIITEGDPADDLFVARAGTFDVFASGTAGGAAGKINEMGPGDVFGEIGIVERMPRTATVVATTDAILWRIPGEVFLDAVATGGGLPGAFGTTMAIRLGRTHPTRVVGTGR